MSCYMTPDDFLKHWQSHRRLTRRTIEAFPDEALFAFMIGGMRPFGVMALEIIGMAVPMLNGLATGDWSGYEPAQGASKAAVLQQWDSSTAEIDRLWPTLPHDRWHETLTAFGAFTGPGFDLMLYLVDNEIHHRGQGYVYLRSLGIEPPAFYERT